MSVLTGHQSTIHGRDSVGLLTVAAQLEKNDSQKNQFYYPPLFEQWATLHLIQMLRECLLATPKPPSELLARCRISLARKKGLNVRYEPLFNLRSSIIVQMKGIDAPNKKMRGNNFFLVYVRRSYLKKMRHLRD